MRLGAWQELSTWLFIAGIALAWGVATCCRKYKR